MEKYAVSDIVKEVKVVTDRNQGSAELVPDDTDTLSQGEIIRSVIVDAAKFIETNAPSSMLNDIAHVSGTPTWTFKDGAYVGRLKLPVDLMRIGTVRVSDWERSTVVADENDDIYNMQGNKWMRGNVQRPYAALVHQDGNLALELYTSQDKTAKVEFSYVPTPNIDSDGNIEMCSKLKDAIVYMAAYLTCVSLGDTETAAGFRSVAYGLADIADVEPQQTQ